jgi:hypothetical protein
MLTDENDRGPAQVYEVVWRSGHVERVLAHQVTFPGAAHALMSPLFAQRPAQIHFHAEIDGRWLPTLIADEADIQTVRLITESEPIPGT